jgi:hypothetical protein
MPFGGLPQEDSLTGLRESSLRERSSVREAMEPFSSAVDVEVVLVAEEEGEDLAW